MIPDDRPMGAPQSSFRLSEITAIGLSVLLLFVGIAWLTGLGGQQDTAESAGSSLSAGPRGALALYRWLQKSGFEVSRAEAGRTFPPDNVDTLFMINPNTDFPSGQEGNVRRWVEDGHTLVLAMGGLDTDIGSGLGSKHPMLRELGIGLTFAGSYTPTLPVSQPLFDRPPVAQVKMPGSFSLQLPVSNTVVLLSTADPGGRPSPLAAAINVGKGKVIVLSSDYVMGNQGIAEADNGAFVYNLTQIAGGKRVAFDEAHHGVSVGGDLVSLLTSNAWGWAIIYGALVAGLYVLWSARRLGPPLPVRTPDMRRPTSDYVTAVAGLFRRASKPGYAAERYLQFFKRTLSRHAELDPYLTDAAFVESLSERGRYPFNPDEMQRAIARLRQLEGVGEGHRASEAVEAETLGAIRDAEQIRRQALGLANEGPETGNHRGDAEAQRDR